jgi:hypothetical protein
MEHEIELPRSVGHVEATSQAAVTGTHIGGSGLALLERSN